MVSPVRRLQVMSRARLSQAHCEFAELLKVSVCLSGLSREIGMRRSSLSCRVVIPPADDSKDNRESDARFDRRGFLKYPLKIEPERLSRKAAVLMCQGVLGF